MDESSKMEIENEILNDDLPRSYQHEMLEMCIRRNTIVYLPTGAGKTFIALLAIRHFSKDLSFSLDEGGKRTIFIVNTVVLARQQAECIQKTFALRTNVYTGDMNVDNWRREKWREEFQTYQVVVATCQIILDILRHGYLTIKDINLIVFDECHHGRRDHPMHQLMSLFERVPKMDHPRVIGLTGMLIAASVKPNTVLDEIEALENTFHATIATVNSYKEYYNVLTFSTNPQEKIIRFDKMPTLCIIITIEGVIRKFLSIINDWPAESIGPSNVLYTNRTVERPLKSLKALLNDFLYQMLDTGVYGASIAILSVLIDLELKKRAAESSSYKNLLRVVITGMEMICHLLEREMSDLKTNVEKILTYSSPKVKQLFLFLEDYLKEFGGKDMKCLVFVKRRYTAKCVYHIIKNYAENNPLFPVSPDFIVGVNNRIPESIESILETKWHRKVLEKFKKNETNLIVASSVLEEGVDLQMCNVVISYDYPQSFRSYAQSKGRARMATSQYVMMTPTTDLLQFRSKIIEYQEIAEILKECLIGKSIDRKAPLKDDIEQELYSHDIVPFYTNSGARLDGMSAVQLLNRYCMMLPRDKFTECTVTWIEKPSEIPGKFLIELELPIQSTITKKIMSDPMASLKLSKRSAAFKACIQLYINEQLTENLMPLSNEKKMECYKDIYFPMWSKYPDDKPKLAGTRKNYRLHEVKYPTQISSCFPKKDIKNYLYIINITEIISLTEQEEKDSYFYQTLLTENRNYAILTSKLISRLALMKLFLSEFQVNVNILAEPIEIKVTENELNLFRNFHIMLFRDILCLSKTFFVYDYDNLENSYLIVPTKNNAINYELIKNFQNLTPLRVKTDRERNSMRFEPSEYYNKVIAPWYRVEQDKRYIVTSIIENQNPCSSFPNTEYKTYEQYYKEKYITSIGNIVNKEQFLVEGKAVTANLNRINCIREKKKLKRSPEILIPELCHNFMYPGDMWLKAILLPSILHRLHFMLHAENIRTDINEFMGIDDSNYIPEELDIDLNPPSEIPDKSQIPKKSIVIPNPEYVPSNEVSQFDFVSLSDLIDCPWKESEEPQDLSRNWNSVYPVEIDYYYQFITQDYKSFEQLAIIENNSSTDSQLAICDIKYDEKKKIKLLQINCLKSVEQRDLLKAITASSSNDVYNMERFEVLGDSFLKFTTSLFLYQKYPDWHEGYLTSCRSKFVSNKNLLYCGIEYELPGIIKLHQFSPKDDWIPPLLTVPRIIQQYMKEFGVSTHLLYKLDLSEDEIKSGQINEDKLMAFVQLFMNETEDQNLKSSMLSLISQRGVSDKAVSDCVEAIIGVCLTTFGIENSFRMLQFFKILPNTEIVTNLLSTMPLSPRLIEISSQREIDDHLINYKTLENTLGYTFIDRAFLLQALTHPSYLSNRVTTTYQQLEFLGDAVLDLLVTSYIFEKCENLDPGKLTDLRSALVNNVTLACIAVRNKIHLFMLSQNSLLCDAISMFAQFQEKNNHKITDQVRLFVEEENVKIADYVDVPKSLGDIIEALVGAIFLDSNKNLDVVWDVIYKLMHKEFEDFMRNIPIEIIRQLYEYPKANPKFSPPFIVDEETVKVSVRFTKMDKILEVYGFGKNKNDAKKAAAKRALHDLLSI